MNHDVKMIVYQDLAHGFLGYDVAGRFNIVKRCIREGAEMLCELLAKSPPQSEECEY